MKRKLDALVYSTGFPSLTLQSFVGSGLLPVTSLPNSPTKMFNGIALLTSIEEVYRG